MSDDDDDFMMSDAESYEFEFEEDDDDEVPDQEMSDNNNSNDEQNKDKDNKADANDSYNSAESLYYRAKSLKSDDLPKALEVFSKIAQVENSDEDDVVEYKFKAVKQKLKILYKLRDYESFMGVLQNELFHLPLDQLQKHYVDESLSKIIDNYNKFDPLSHQLQLYDIVLTHYTKNERLIIRTLLKQMQVLLTLKRYNEMFQLLSSIHDGHKLDKFPEMTKNAYQLELYALEIQAHSDSNNLLKLKELYKKTLSIQSTIPHPRINAVIKECGGKISMRDGNYEQACDEFYESFKNYDEIGNQEKRIKLLQYLIVASILSNDEINKFESQETKYFLKDEEVLKFVQLLQLFEKLDHLQFAIIYEQLLSDWEDDVFMVQNLHKVEEILKLRLLIHYIKPFKRLSLDKLSKTLKIPVDSIESTFLSLRNNGQIPNVRLDLVDGIVFNE